MASNNQSSPDTAKTKPVNLTVSTAEQETRIGLTGPINSVEALKALLQTVRLSGTRLEFEAAKRGQTPEDFIADLALVLPSNDALLKDVFRGLLHPAPTT